MKKIAIDIDDVIYPTFKDCLAMCRRIRGSAPKYEEVVDWNLDEHEYFKDMFSVLLDNVEYDQTRAYPRACTIIRKLIKKGHDVVFQTGVTTARQAQLKWDFINLHFGDQPIIFYRVTNLNSGKDLNFQGYDILIDDCGHFVDFNQYRVSHPILMRRPWNKKYRNSYTAGEMRVVRSWAQIGTLLNAWGYL
jgi:hypothetical protein